MANIIIVLIVFLAVVIGVTKCGRKRKNNGMKKEISPTVTPTTAEIPASGGNSVHSLTNPTKHRFVYKVGTTDPEHYLVSQSYGFLESSESMNMEVQRTPGIFFCYLIIFLTEIAKTLVYVGRYVQKQTLIQFINLDNPINAAVTRV